MPWCDNALLGKVHALLRPIIVSVATSSESNAEYSLFCFVPVDNSGRGIYKFLDSVHLLDELTANNLMDHVRMAAIRTTDFMHKSQVIPSIIKSGDIQPEFFSHES